MGKIFSTSVSRMMVLTAYLTALFSAFAMIAAAVPYVFSGGLCDIPDGPPVDLSFSKVFSMTLSMILDVLVSMVLLFLMVIPTLEMVDITEVALVVTTIGVGVDTVGGGIGASGAVSESTIAVMGELENALFEDCEESSSLSVSDSEPFSCSSSMGSSSSSFSGVPSLLPLIEAGSSSRGGVEAPGGGMLFSSSSVVTVGPCVPEASVVAAVALSEAGEVGDFSSLNPFSSERIFVLLELMLLLEDADDEDELDDAVEDELLLLVLAGHFLIGSSESVSLVLSSVCIERDEMSVLLDVRRLDDDDEEVFG